MINLEGESIRSRMESMGWCVKLKTVTDIRQSSAHDAFKVESIYFVLNSLWDWKLVERLRQRSIVISLTFLSDWSKQQHSSECTEGYSQRKQEDQKGKNCISQGTFMSEVTSFHWSRGGKILLYRADLVKLVVTRLGVMINEASMNSVLSRRTLGLTNTYSDLTDFL